ncbi:hypothetical protein [Saccharococcus caldoxylosilyticus]|uniref:Uncharacterized protein n=2 Tax=Saccharococcus caldoxylosilyticus TaxID=81408 RepID=A0A023DEE7_9BACL|nr:hypothetical protein [Parageobacillus caldoxylosilyticus]KYD18108.1 hypothetical protein B4119_0802 [Parageobacillus caldoxylosilyticus]MBB3852700.1 hypothetical protein [Parageobacillus caldoxylosilyticus]QXJ37770.1 hypothetical protein BV455_01033 [Parageobacillus caldoxylosilyticus]GAJ39617.1 hypothetical protein GCA01S_022_00970 [Parageobacillus caldoxylosilyticus NBRC 107762]
MIPTNTAYETNIRLPLLFIVFGVVAFVAAQAILLAAGPAAASGVFRLPSIWAAAHLAVLGFALMIAMGAMYQLVPVAFLTPIWSEQLGFVQFFITAAGIIAFSMSLAFYAHVALFPGVLLVLGIILFLFQMGMTLRKQAKKNIMTLFVGSALLFLLLTILFGLTLALHFWSGNEAADHLFILKTHILFGMCGWFSLLIMGFSYKMVPMFSLAHGFSMKLARYVYVFYVTGLIVTFISFFQDGRGPFAAGAGLLLTGFALFAYHIWTILQKRVKKKLDRPFQFALLAIGIALILHTAAFLLPLSGNDHGMAIVIYAYVFGWIMFSIIGYLYKIVPFLWWTHRYSKKIGQENVPTLKQMINEKWTIVQCILFTVSLVGVVIALTVSSLPLFYAAQSAMTLFSLFFASTMISVLWK